MTGRLKPSTHPVLTLVRNPPPIHSKSPPILLRPRPLNRHIARTHERLANIIETMPHMPLLRLKQKIVNLVPVLAVHTRLQREEVRADVRQTVQLVEEGDVVDLASGGGFA